LEQPPLTTPPRRLVTPQKRDDDADASIRPLALADFTARRRRARPQGVH